MRGHWIKIYYVHGVTATAKCANAADASHTAQLVMFRARGPHAERVEVYRGRTMTEEHGRRKQEGLPGT